METIVSITEFFDRSVKGDFKSGCLDIISDGFDIVTTEQTITLAIASDQQCCESWGYLLSEDDPKDFIGASIKSIYLTDTQLKTLPLSSSNQDANLIFVNIETDRGVLQFVAYNEHNGYYGHDVNIQSKQLTQTEML